MDKIIKKKSSFNYHTFVIQYKLNKAYTNRVELF